VGIPVLSCNFINECVLVPYLARRSCVCFATIYQDRESLILYTVLVDSWEQCKDADVLLESPSAMAGVHIAEALR
jgi:hypothetical protein